MLRSIFILILLASGMQLSAQVVLTRHAARSFSNYQIIIDDASTVKILGKTNVNKFECNFCGDISSDTLYIQETGNHSIKSFDNTQLKIPVGGFDCGIKMMTKDMMQLLDRENHPFLKVKVKKLVQKGSMHEATTELIIAGKSRTYCIPVYAVENGNWVYSSGKAEINIENFGLKPPTKFLGAVKVKKVIEVEFNLKLKIKEVSRKFASRS